MLVYMIIEKYSEILKQKIYIDSENQTIKTADGCFYSKQEFTALRGLSDKMKFKIHKVKNFFKGEII